MSEWKGPEMAFWSQWVNKGGLNAQVSSLGLPPSTSRSGGPVGAMGIIIIVLAVAVAVAAAILIFVIVRVDRTVRQRYGAANAASPQEGGSRPTERGL